MVTFLDILIEHELVEASPLKKKIPRSVTRERHIAYLKNKARAKLKAKKFRRSSKYLKYKKLAKKMSKTGKTASGKRKVTFL